MVTRASRTTAAAACVAGLVLSGCAGDAETSTALERTDTTRAAAPAKPAAPAKKDKHADAASRAPSKADLNAYIAKARRQVKAAFGSFNGMYSEVRINPVYPNGMQFVYVYSEFVDVSGGAEYLDTSAPILRKTFVTLIAPEMERIGFARPKATWTYLNPDESLIWTRTFTKS